MKKIILFCLIPLFTVAIIAGGTVTTITNSTTFAKAGEIDTTSTYSLKYYDKAFLQLAIHGTDSIKVLMACDGLVGTKWDLGVKYDTLFLNETSAPDACKAMLLRGYGTTGVGGYERVRFRITFGAVGADDSTSALYYKAYIIHSD